MHFSKMILFLSILSGIAFKFFSARTRRPPPLLRLGILCSRHFSASAPSEDGRVFSSVGGILSSSRVIERATVR